MTTTPQMPFQKELLQVSKVGPNKLNTFNIKTSLTYKHVVQGLYLKVSLFVFLKLGSLGHE